MIADAGLATLRQAGTIIVPGWEDIDADPPDALLELRTWVQKHLDHNLTIADLAAKVRMSRRTFIRKFEAATGISPGEWVLQERTARTRHLLEGTGMSIEQVATAVGFGSADALRHHFRMRYQPGALRSWISRIGKAPVRGGATLARNLFPDLSHSQPMYFGMQMKN